MAPTSFLRRILFFALLVLVPVLSGCLPVVAAAVVGLLEALDSDTDGSNIPPAVILEEVQRDGAASEVSVEIRAIDAGRDSVTLEVSYRVGSSAWQPASVTPTTVQASPAGETTTLTWAAATDLGSSAYQDELQLRVIPDDGANRGEAAISNRFAFGNDPPEIQSITFDSPENVVSGTAIIRLTVADPGSDATDLTGFELSLTGDFSDAQEIEITTDSGGNFPVGSVTGLSTEPSGVEHTFGWDSFQSAPLFSASAQVRLQVTDEHGAESEWVSSEPFVLENQGAPTVRIVEVKRAQPDGLRTGPLEMILRLEDDESDIVDLHVEFSTDGETWYPCTEYRAPLSSGRRDLPTRPGSAGGLEQTFWWDTASDLFAYQSEVYLRAHAHDGWQASLPYEYPLSLEVGPHPSVEPFAAPTTIPTSYAPDWAVVADFNGNGIDDIAVGSGYGDYEIEVYLGGSEGLTSPAFSHTMVDRPQAMAAGDVNDNGVQDLLIRKDFETEIWLGDGTGSFSYHETIETTPTMQERPSLAIADFTGNGAVDIVVNAYFGQDFVEVWINDGTGSFPEVDKVEVFTSGSGAANAVRAGDVTGNGHNDLVILAEDAEVGGSLEDTVQVFEGDGTGSFASPQVLIPGPWLHGLALADVTGNGRNDIVVGDWVSRLHVLESEGEATFTIHDPISTGVDFVTFPNIVPADLTGNEIDDLLVHTMSEYTMRISLGSDVNGAPGFLEPMVGFSTFYFFRGVEAGDFTGNGRADVAIFHDGGFEVQYAQGGQRPFSDVVEHPSVGTGVALAVGDVTLNGGLDLVMLQRYDAAPDHDLVQIFHAETRNGVPTGSYSKIETLTIPSHPGVLELADVSGNGWLDLVVGTMEFENPQLSVVPNSASGFESPQTYSLTRNPTAITFGDIDESGDLDIIVATDDPAGVLDVFHNDGNGGFGSSSTISLDDGAQEVELLDLTGDGHLDLIYRITDAFDSWVHLRPGDGTGNFDAVSPIEVSMPGDFVPIGVRLADISGNGRADVISWGIDPDTESDDRWIVVCENEGDGTFGTGVVTVIAVQELEPITTLAFGDFSHNGALDVAIADETGEMRIRFNDGDLGFEPATLPTAAGFFTDFFPHDLHAVDLTGDGLLDLVWIHLDLTKVHLAFGTAPVYPPFATPLLEPSDTLGGDVLVEEADRFGVSDDDNRLSRRLYSGLHAHGPVPPEWGHLRANVRFRELIEAAAAGSASLEMPAELTPLSPAYVFEGAVRVTQIEDPDGTTDTRLRLGARFGPLITPQESASTEREGLDMSSTVNEEQRALILDLPIDEAIDPGDIDAGTVRVYMRVLDWTRAEAFADDPLFGMSEGAELLPRVLSPATQSYRDVFVPHWEWLELEEDLDGDLSTTDGIAGPRFVVDQSASPPVIRMATDQLGVVQAFLEEE